MPRQTKVEYPEQGAGEADVVLDITVGVDGTTSDIVVVSGAAPFDVAAQRAARGWRFDPALRDGRPVAARIRYALRFAPTSPEEPPPTAEPALAPAGGESGAIAPPPMPSAPTEVVVRGARRAPGSVAMVSTEVRNLPGAFGDPLRAVEAQPGVVPIVSGVPTFFIRGAPPANVGFFIDGIDVPLLYHAFLGPSVIHPSIIESVDVNRGASPVEYGRFAGPTVAANVRPFEDRWHGEGNLRAIDVGALVEAPLGSCEKTEAAGAECPRGNARVSGRYSYTGLVLSAISDARLNYWDYQTQVRYALGQHDSVGVFAFGAHDFFRGTGDVVEESNGGEVTFHRVDLRWDHRFSHDADVRFAVTGGFDRSGGAESDSTSVTDRSLRARAQLRAALSPQVTLRAGLDARVDQFELQTRPLALSFPDFTVLFPTRIDRVAGAYASVELAPVSWITIVPGVRADVYETSGTTAVGVDPRIAAAFAVSREVTLEHSFGIAHQRPNFAAQVPGAQVADLTGGLQEAFLWSSGVRWKMPGDVIAAVNLFRNGFFHALDPLGGARDFTLDRTILERRSTISAQGLEVSITRPLTHRLGGFLSYTLSRSEESSGRQHSVSGFDRPHVVQAALSYEVMFGIRVGARVIFYSGIPELNLEGSPHFSTEQRGTPYFRLDTRLEKRWRLGGTGWLSATAEMLNTTSTREVIRLDCGAKCVQRYAGPVILPSVGVEAGF